MQRDWRRLPLAPAYKRRRQARERKAQLKLWVTPAEQLSAAMQQAKQSAMREIREILARGPNP